MTFAPRTTDHSDNSSLSGTSTKVARGDLFLILGQILSGQRGPLQIHIPKGKGKTRPIGVAAFEDKIVQDAVREVLQAIYEQDFLPCSVGFRPGRSAHDALRALNRAVYRGEVNIVLEADIESFFDSLVRTELMEMLRERVVDGSILRLVEKCLNVGILDGQESLATTEGVTQGSALSPLLGNVYRAPGEGAWI